VATPIGNLSDITLRALQVLKDVPLIAAEDTRHSRTLLARYGIGTTMTACHEHNEEAAIPALIRHLHAGQDLALISDAGTPLVSDPGFRLVRAAQDNGCPVATVPGPSALVSALSVSGIASDRFAFEGFLPRRTEARRRRLAALKVEPRTLVFYETPRRLSAALEDLVTEFGDNREATLAREMTKQFETIRRMTLGQLRDWVRDEPTQQQGEVVLVVGGRQPDPSSLDARDLGTMQILLGVLPLKQAAEVAARITGRSRNALYRAGLDLKDDSGTRLVTPD
jgi:16S rRNA (cytidine1402-2'-O)-methyltransferase